MPTFPHTQHPPSFKAAVALEALKGEHALADIASRFHVTEEEVRQWQEMLTQNAELAFAPDKPMVKAEAELIESRQKALQAARLAESERRRLNALLEAAPVGILMADASGHIREMNAANADIWGTAPSTHSVEEYRQWKGWWADGSDKHGKRIEPHEWAMARALKGEKSVQDIADIEPFDSPGKRVTIVIHATPIFDAEGRIIGGVVAQMDITEYMRVEEGLQESEAKLRAITNAMPQMVWSTLPDGYHDYYNQQWYDFTGVSEGATDGTGWNRMFHPDDRQRAWEKWHHSLATGETYEVEYRLRHHSGQYRWTLGRALPVRNEAGEITRWMGTCTDIHDHKMAEEELKAANRQKDDFLAMLAHELRNPLAPISTAADLLGMYGSPDAVVSQAAEIITRQASHMTTLVNDLLDVSRVTRGLVELDKTVLEIGPIVDNAIEQARPMIDAKHHTLRKKLSSSDVRIFGDRARLIQIISNLLTNSAKYTPVGGQIEIVSYTEDGQLIVKVTDNGNGIDASLLPHVFELFAQGSRTPDRASGGLGLGLSLVRSLMDLHGGRVEADSEGPGKGCTFTLTLPLFTERAERVSESGSAVAARTDGVERKRHIMIVDDNVDAARTLALYLTSKGHRVSVEDHPEKALHKTRKNPPDVFVLDIGLPEMDGYELARRLRSQQETAQALLIALTGYGQERDKRLARQAGFNYHSTKPARPEQLLAMISPGE